METKWVLFFLLKSHQYKFRIKENFWITVSKNGKNWPFFLFFSQKSNTVSLAFALEKKGIALTILSKIEWNSFLSNILCRHDITATTTVMSHTFHELNFLFRVWNNKTRAQTYHTQDLPSLKAFWQLSHRLYLTL